MAVDPAPPQAARAAARARVEADIVRVARAQLAQVGPSELSVRAVARELGMGSASIYRYVASRDEVLGRLQVAMYAELAQHVEEREAAVAQVWAAKSAGRVRPDAVLARWRGHLRRRPGLGSRAPARLRAGLRAAGARLCATDRGDRGGVAGDGRLPALPRRRG